MVDQAQGPQSPHRLTATTCPCHGLAAMDISPEYYGLIEGGISLFAVLAFAGWQLWSLREKPGEKDDSDEGDAG